MPMTSDISESAIQPGAEFPITHWSVVLSASDPGSARAAEALEKLCRIYWYPLYAYVRRRGKTPPDAQDLTQEFFARLLARHWLGRADQARGRFRTFLLTALERFLANEWDKGRALKRGGVGNLCRWTGPRRRTGMALSLQTR
jgi:RNA polymerase sigma-70 factor (ECF subfamily)